MTSPQCCVCACNKFEPYSIPTDYITGERFSVVRCSCCGLIFVCPQPPERDLAHYYPSGHQQAEPASYEKLDAKARIGFVERFITSESGRVLDVGCGKGVFLQGLQKRGWQAFGTELSEISSAYARSQGVVVYTTKVEKAPFEPESFDLITLFHVLEHLTHPQDTLASLFGLLRPGGTLLIEVPNIGSWYAKVFGNNWFHYDVPRHLFHFNPDTLRQIIINAGFDVSRVETRNLQYDAFGAVQSFLNCFLAKTNLLNNFNTKQTTFKELLASNERISNLAALVFSELVLAIGFPLMAVASTVLSKWTDGGTLRVLARKPESFRN